MRYSPFRHLGSVVWKRRPIQLTYFLTRRCNARCSFCFYLSGTPGTDPELSPDEIARTSVSLGRLLWLALSGGEPFLRTDLVDIVQTFYRNNRPSIILLPTNGLLPDLIEDRTEAILRSCPNSTIAVKLSLDGPEDIHDALRGVPGAFGKVQETYRRLNRLLDRHPHFELGFNSVLCSANQDRMPELLALVQKLGPHVTHTVSLVRGRVRDDRMAAVDPANYRAAAERISANLSAERTGTYRFSGARLKAAQDVVQRRLIHRTAAQQRGFVRCTAGRLTLVLTETGDLYPCESFERKLGNVRSAAYDVPAVLRTPACRSAIRSITGKGCFCTHECYMMMNVLFDPCCYPALLRELLRLRLRRRNGRRTVASRPAPS